MWSARQTWKMGRRAAGFLGGLLATILLVAAPAAAAFVDPINLSNSSAAISGRPGIAVNGAGQVFAVWEEGVNGQTNIVFARSQPALASCGGLQFGAPRILSAGPGASMPAVAANDSGGVFVVWQASSEVWVNRSTDNGATFLTDKGLPPVNLSNDATQSNSPTVAADGSGVFVAWSDGSAGQILFRRSLDSGATFVPNPLLAPAANVSQTPFTSTSQVASVAAGGGHVFLAWEERQRFGLVVPSRIRYKKFSPSADLATVAGLPSLDLSFPLFRATGPSLAFGDNILSVAFASFTDVYHRESRNAPDFSTFSALEPSFSGVVASPSNARGARRNGSAMVAWAQSLAGSTDIRHRVLGATTVVEPVLNTAARRASPAAAVDSTGRLLVAWQGREPADLSNGVTADEVYVSYREGTGGGEMPATVWASPQVLNFRTVGRGTGEQPNFTVFIELPDGSAGNINLKTLRLKVNGNEYQPLPGPSALGDHDGNGIMDLMVKFNRSIFDGAGVATAAQSVGNYTVSYTVTGETSPPNKGCFKSGDAVQIMR